MPRTVSADLDAEDASLPDSRSLATDGEYLRWLVRSARRREALLAEIVELLRGEPEPVKKTRKLRG